jgi:hypothetical protein
VKVPYPGDDHDQAPPLQFLPRVGDDPDAHAVPLRQVGRAGELPVLAELAGPDPLVEPVRDLQIRPLVDGERRLVVTVRLGLIGVLHAGLRT